MGTQHIHHLRPNPDIYQVLALDKRYLDPRRSANPTPAEKEEGIIPLTDSLPIIPQVLMSFTVPVTSNSSYCCLVPTMHDEDI